MPRESQDLYRRPPGRDRRGEGAGLYRGSRGLRGARRSRLQHRLSPRVDGIELASNVSAKADAEQLKVLEVISDALVEVAES